MCNKLFFMFFACLLALAPNAEAGQRVGQVMAMQPGVSVLRGQEVLPLAVRDAILLTDEVRTDANGKVQVLFDDDTSISLGPDTAVAVEEYVDNGPDSAFKTNLLQGVLRAVTGRLVVQNPDGFFINAPSATVGIRGTILAVSSQAGKTTVYVENSRSNKVFVNGMAVPQAFKLTIGDSEPRAITPDDEVRISRITVPMLGQLENPQPATREQQQRIARGQALLNQGEGAQAFRIFSALLRENPLNHEINTGLAQSALAAGYLNQAVIAYERLLERHPDDVNVLNGLATAYQQLGDPTTAARFFSRAARL